MRRPWRRTGVLLAAGLLGCVAVLVPLVPYNKTVWTSSPADNSPSGDVALHYGAPVVEAFRSGEWRVLEPPVEIPRAACRPTARVRLGGSGLAAVVAFVLVLRGRRPTRPTVNSSETGPAST